MCCYLSADVRVHLHTLITHMIIYKLHLVSFCISSFEFLINSCAFARLGIIWFLMNYFRSHADTFNHILACLRRRIKMAKKKANSILFCSLISSSSSSLPSSSFNYLILSELLVLSNKGQSDEITYRNAQIARIELNR